MECGEKVQEGKSRTSLYLTQAARKTRNLLTFSIFCQCILNLCDLQIVTGFGILIAGFYCLEDTSSYHWQIVVHLAWFANITHITTLTFLRDYLHSRKDLRQRNIRIFTMLLFLIMLLVAEFPTGFFNWPNVYRVVHNGSKSWLIPKEAYAANASSYAICFFNMNIARERLTSVKDCYPCPLNFQDTTAFQSMIVSMVLLVFNFGTRVVKLSMTLSSIFNHKVRESLSRWFRYLILLSVRPRRDPASPHWPGNRRAYIITKPLMALFLVARLYVDMGTSTLAEVSSRIPSNLQCVGS